MATNLPSVKRFYSEDYKEAQPFFQRFLGQLNLFTEPIYNLMNGSLGVQSNTNEEIYLLSISTASATGTSNTFTFLPKKFVGKPNGVLLGQCLYNTSSGVATAVGSPVTFDWVYNGSQIQILAVYGLTAGKSYTLSLRIY